MFLYEICFIDKGNFSCVEKTNIVADSFKEALEIFTNRYSVHDIFIIGCNRSKILGGVN